MLAHLEHFYLPLQQLEILQTQFFLLDDLNGALPPGAFVDRLLDKTVLTLSEVILQFVEVIEIGVTDCLLNCAYPLLLFLNGVQVINAPFIREDQHEGVQFLVVFNHVFDLILYVDARQTLHFLVS